MKKDLKPNYLNLTITGTASVKLYNIIAEFKRSSLKDLFVDFIFMTVFYAFMPTFAFKLTHQS